MRRNLRWLVQETSLPEPFNGKPDEWNGSLTGFFHFLVFAVGPLGGQERKEV